MCIQEYLDDMQNLQDGLLVYLENQADSELNYQNLINTINKQKICSSKQELTLLLHLISTISQNYCRNFHFISKIEKVLGYLGDYITSTFTNLEKFKIFKHNKRILLFLLEKNILTLDEFIVRKMISKDYLKAKYPQYFSPEIKPFMKLDWFPKSERSNWVKELEEFENQENFSELRKEGENEDYICKLIRSDSIDEFIQYVNRSNYSLKSTISDSIYETNLFLIESNKNDLTLIKYAAFFGSIQIFKYLLLNKVELTPQLWIYAIHGKNADIIHLLEEYKIEPPKKSYKESLIESIKCHYNDIVDYLLNQYFQIENQNSNDLYIEYIKNYNFSFFNDEFLNDTTFFYLCKYGYCSLMSFALNDEKINVNKILIFQ